MEKKFKMNRLEVVMRLLDLSAYALERESGVDNTLISKWQQGVRPMTRRSKKLRVLAEAIVRLDRDNVLGDFIAPYRQQGESAVDGLHAYLMDMEQEGLTPRIAPVERQLTGGYTVEYRVFLGQQGYRDAALIMLDYLLTLPPDQELFVLNEANYEWVKGNLPFVMQFLSKLRKVFDRGVRMQVISRKEDTRSEITAFAGPWMVAHLMGHIRTSYYEGALPAGICYAGLIPGYWSATAEDDPEVEDSLYTEMHTDVKALRQVEGMLAVCLSKRLPAAQYDFFANPAGSEKAPRLWAYGPLPGRAGMAPPSGCFHTISRVPAFGMITQKEFAALAGPGQAQQYPAFLFRDTEGYAEGPHRIILCREDVRDGLRKQRRMHEALSALMHRRVFVSSAMLRAQIKRLLDAMSRQDFEVALVPRVAYEKIQMEAVSWKDSVSVGWLQGMEDSMFTDDPYTSACWYGAAEYTWERLLAGWKRKDKVKRQLRKWLEGKELEEAGEDSAIVKGWDLMPR